jgi:PKD repeat protein
MTRAITAGELVTLRKNGQAAKLFMAVYQPSTIAAGTLDAPPSSDNMAADLDWTKVSGTSANILTDMLVYVGTSAGAYDKGMVRIRKTSSDTVLYIGAVSEIDWTAGDHLTVVNEFPIHARNPRILSGTIYMDYDTAYSAQHSNPDPIVNIGPDVVLWMSGATVVFTPTCSPLDWTGTAIVPTSYTWVAAGASATSDLTTATPTITYNAAGSYLVSCTVVTSGGASFQRHLIAIVTTAASPGITEFDVDTFSGEYLDGGWSCAVTLYDQATKTELRDRSRVLIWARDWYGGVEGSYGPVDHAENLIMSGWLLGETIQPDPAGKSVSFQIGGPQAVLRTCRSQSGSLSATDFGDGAAVSWERMANVTVPKALWHLARWRSTLSRCCDIRLSADVAHTGTVSFTAGDLMSQFGEVARKAVAALVCNSAGQVWIDRDPQTIRAANRAAVPVVMSITSTDWSTMTIIRREFPEIGRAEISGTAFAGGVDVPVGAISPGDVPAVRGGGEAMAGDIAIATQADVIELAGWLAGAGAAEIANIDTTLAMNNRFFDIAPNQYAQVSIASGDTERGFTVTDYEMIPRSVRYPYSSATGVLVTQLALEGVGPQWPAVAMTFPGEGEPPIEPPPIDPPPDPPPGGGGGGGGGGDVPPEPGGLDAIVASSTDVRTTADLSVASPTWTTEL